jgi:hypothetical protein
LSLFLEFLQQRYTFLYDLPYESNVGKSRMRIELEEKVVIETKKLIEAGFIQAEENPA